MRESFGRALWKIYKRATVSVRECCGRELWIIIEELLARGCLAGSWNCCACLLMRGPGWRWCCPPGRISLPQPATAVEHSVHPAIGLSLVSLGRTISHCNMYLWKTFIKIVYEFLAAVRDILDEIPLTYSKTNGGSKTNISILRYVIGWWADISRAVFIIFLNLVNINPENCSTSAHLLAH